MQDLRLRRFGQKFFGGATLLIYWSVFDLISEESEEVASLSQEFSSRHFRVKKS
jgi:hypothetical protein